MQVASEKVLFANQLRAIAVISVIITHWLGVFWIHQETVASYIYAPIPEGPALTIYRSMLPPTFNLGPFGVAVFFLISGFVIPFSLKKAEPLEFLTSRALRIYPTYFAATAVSLLFVWASSKYWGQPMKIDSIGLIHNLALIHTVTLQKTIDLVNWSLSIEIKFYIIAAIVYKSIRSGNVMPMLAVSAAILLANIAIPVSADKLSIGMLDISVRSLKTELMTVAFMFIGTCFYHHYTGKLTNFGLTSCTTLLLLVVIFSAPHNDWSPAVLGMTLNYSYALILFSTFYSLKNHIRPLRPLDFIARISYPLYIIHSLCGYVILRALIDYNVTFFWAVVIAGLIVTSIAYGLHLTIERSTMHAGRKIFSRAKKAPAN